jgi:hypothetical protein
MVGGGHLLNNVHLTTQYFTTRDLGAHSFSSPFVTSYCKLVQEHEQLKLNIGTLLPNRYKSMYLSCTPSGPDALTQIHWSVGGRKHR